MKFVLRARFAAEFLGTAFLVAAVVGSGIMGERLAGGNVAIALLANTIATGAALLALILTFGSISGAHFNPAVTLADAVEHGIPWGELPFYIAAQCTGGTAGTVVAHLMFGFRWLFALHALPSRMDARLQRIRSNIRIVVSHLGMFPYAVRCDTLRRRRLHQCRVLVYCLYLLCEPGGYALQSLIGHFRRDRAGGRSAIHCGSTGWSHLRNPAVSLARAE
ncbi:MAG TPA: MIP/aquaporin family protein [Terriglobales bacterium]|nr:MIP/aquaporin family protein [Terriglobales bacterium]